VASEPTYITEEPDTGSVVALDWRGPYQEVWVSNSSNIGKWYTPDALIGPAHPHWEDVVQRAKAMGTAITLLVAADTDTYRAGYRAGVDAVKAVVENAMGDARYADPGVADHG
jgi:hypothetical protein